MRVHKILNICVILLIIETCTSKPLNDNSPITSKRELVDYVFSTITVMTEKYIDKYLELSPQLQKDESLELRDEAEIVEFKANVSKFLDNYDKNGPYILNLVITKDFVDCVEYYFKLTEEQLTPESKFILELLKKYQFKEVHDESEKDIKEFLDDFKIKFEELKPNLDEPMLEWYEKFSSLTEFDEQMKSFEKFVRLI